MFSLLLVVYSDSSDGLPTLFIQPQAVSTDSNSAMDFASILYTSLVRRNSYKATCQKCKQFVNFESVHSIPTRNLPPILALNANVHNEENLEYWLDNRKMTFLKPRVQLRGQTEVIDDFQSAIYEFRASILLFINTS